MGSGAGRGCPTDCARDFDARNRDQLVGYIRHTVDGINEHWFRVDVGSRTSYLRYKSLIAAEYAANAEHAAME